MPNTFSWAIKLSSPSLSFGSRAVACTPPQGRRRKGFSGVQLPSRAGWALGATIKLFRKRRPMCMPNNIIVSAHLVHAPVGADLYVCTTILGVWPNNTRCMTQQYYVYGTKPHTSTPTITQFRKLFVPFYPIAACCAAHIVHIQADLLLAIAKLFGATV